MTLAVDNQLEIENRNSLALEEALGRWSNCLPSVILHHGKACCSIAREWLFATDHSLLNGHPNLMGPRWVRQRYNWGPSQWPMAWCHAVEQKSLDCGALAALSHDLFAARGIRCHSVQLIQQYTEETASHWLKKWTDHTASTHWIEGGLIYHEACAVEVARNEIKLWDPTAGCWVNPKQFGGYGSILAVRVTASFQDVADSFIWGEQRISCGNWNKIHFIRHKIPETQGRNEDVRLQLFGFVPTPSTSELQRVEDI
jgi:hypothetical protein